MCKMVSFTTIVEREKSAMLSSIMDACEGFSHDFTADSSNKKRTYFFHFYEIDSHDFTVSRIRQFRAFNLSSNSLLENKTSNYPKISLK